MPSNEFAVAWLIIMFAIYGAGCVLRDLIEGPHPGWASWWRRMRWHVHKLKRDPEDAIAKASDDPPEWFP